MVTITTDNRQIESTLILLVHTNHSLIPFSVLCTLLVTSCKVSQKQERQQTNHISIPVPAQANLHVYTHKPLL